MPPDVVRAGGTAGFLVWLSGPGSGALLTVTAPPGTEIRFVGCPTPEPSRPPEKPEKAVKAPEKVVPVPKKVVRAPEGSQKCLVGQVGTRKAVGVMLSAPTAGSGSLSAPAAGSGSTGLAATLRMRTPEGEWVTRTATDPWTVRLAGGGPGETDIPAHQDSVGVEIEPIGWVDEGAGEGPGSLAWPGGSGSPESGVPGEWESRVSGGWGLSEAPDVPEAWGVAGPQVVPGAAGVPEVPGVSGGPGVPVESAWAPIREPRSVWPVRGPGVAPPPQGVEVVPPGQG
ncbi:hypothetical protein ACFQ08_17985, partial [Streptosporangium algeriense]